LDPTTCWCVAMSVPLPTGPWSLSDQRISYRHSRPPRAAHPCSVTSPGSRSNSAGSSLNRPRVSSHICACRCSPSTGTTWTSARPGPTSSATASVAPAKWFTTAPTWRKASSMDSSARMREARLEPSPTQSSSSPTCSETASSPVTRPAASNRATAWSSGIHWWASPCTASDLSAEVMSRVRARPLSPASARTRATSAWTTAPDTPGRATPVCSTSSTSNAIATHPIYSVTAVRTARPVLTCSSSGTTWRFSLMPR
jgi:hypothetical protein